MTFREVIRMLEDERLRICSGKMSDYLAVIEYESDSWGAYCPDLPGLGVVGETREEVESLIREAVELHLTGLRAAGEPVPTPSAVDTARIHVPAA